MGGSIFVEVWEPGEGNSDEKHYGIEEKDKVDSLFYVVHALILMIAKIFVID